MTLNNYISIVLMIMRKIPSGSVQIITVVEVIIITTTTVKTTISTNLVMYASK